MEQHNHSKKAAGRTFIFLTTDNHIRGRVSKLHFRSSGLSRLKPSYLYRTAAAFQKADGDFAAPIRRSPPRGDIQSRR
jgi:hypothetical protein